MDEMNILKTKLLMNTRLQIAARFPLVDAISIHACFQGSFICLRSIYLLSKYEILIFTYVKISLYLLAHVLEILTDLAQCLRSFIFNSWKC